MATTVWKNTGGTFQSRVADEVLEHRVVMTTGNPPYEFKNKYNTTIAQIRLHTGKLPSEYFSTTDKGQEGDWVYDPIDTVSADNTGTILVTADGKRLKRMFSGGVSVKWFGAIGDGTVDDVEAINSTIQYVVDKFGGEAYFPSGIYSISSSIIGRRSVVLNGEGGYDYSGMPTQYGTTIRPTDDFSSDQVIIFDSAEDLTPLASGCGITNIAIDMVNISDSGKSAIVLRSITNIGLIKNIVVNKLDHGSALVMDVTATGGGLATDGIDVVGFFCYGKTSGYSSNIPKLLIQNNVNEINFRGCKFQSSSAAVAGTISVLMKSGSRGITFDGCSFAGNETGIKIISDTELLSPPEWIRFINNTFETYRYGIYIDATGTSDPNFYPKFITVLEGNRFLQAAGENCRNVFLGKSTGCIIGLDEFVEAGTSGTSKLAEITVNSSGNIIRAQPSQVINNSITSIVMGRTGNSCSFSKIDITGPTGDNDILLKNTASNTANGTIRWQGADGSSQAAIGSNFTTSDVGALEFLNGSVLGMILRSTGKLEITSGLKVGSVVDYADNSSALAGGLVAGDVYRTGDLLKIVH